MKLEARNAILIGIGLVVYGCIALAWDQRHTLTETVSSKSFNFSKLRRDEMIEQEHNAEEYVPETETGV